MPETTTETQDEQRPASACTRGLDSQSLTLGRTCCPDLTLDVNGDEFSLTLEGDEWEAHRCISRAEARHIIEWLGAALAG